MTDAGIATTPRYRYIAEHLGAPFSRIAELPLSNVQYQRRINGAGTFRANLKLPTITMPEPRTVITQEEFVDPDAGLYLDGTAGTRAATSDHSSLDITDELWLGVKFQTTAVSDASIIASKFHTSGDQRSWYFGVNSSNELAFASSSDGISAPELSSTEAVVTEVNTWYTIGVHALMNDGGGNSVITFYKADDIGEPWEQVGDPIVGASSSIFNSTADLVIGGINDASFTVFNFNGGIIDYFEMREGNFGGASVAKPNFATKEAGTTSFTDAASKTWSLFNNANIQNDSQEEITTVVQDTNEDAKRLARLYIEATDRGTTCIYVLREGVPMGCWIVWDQEYDAETQSLSIGGAELTSYFRRRIMENTSQDGTLDDIVGRYEQSTFASTVIEGVLSTVNDIGLSIRVPPNSGVQEDLWEGWRGTDGKAVGDILNDMSDPVDGFDYRTEIDISGDDFIRILRLSTEFDDPGPFIPKFHTSMPSLKVKRRGDLRSNDYIVLGGNEGPKRPFGRDSSAAFEPKLQTVVQISDEDRETILENQAEGGLEAFLNHEVVDLSAVPSVDTDLGLLQPGSRIRIHVPHDVDPFFQSGLDLEVRMIGFDISVPDTGGEESIGLAIEESGEEFQS